MQNMYHFPGFQFLACSGDNTTTCDVHQVKSVQFGSPDLVSITIGGDNNKAFGDLVRYCVYERLDLKKCTAAFENAENATRQLKPYLDSLFNDIKNMNACSTWKKSRGVVVPADLELDQCH